LFEAKEDGGGDRPAGCVRCTGRQPGIGRGGDGRRLADLSQVNDAGFWLVKEYFNMSVTQTLKTWTVMETIVSIVALVFALLLNAMLS